MPKVFLSPSNQFENRYAYGGSNEGKQMGIVANLVKVALQRCGFEVMLMHDQTMAEKVRTANNWGADLYIPIHSNACNGKVSGTRMFCWSIPGAGYDACLAIYRYLAPLTPGESESIRVADDLYEVKWPYAPVAYIETDFHDVPSVAKWLTEHTAEIAEAICKGVCSYFKVQYVAPKNTPAGRTCDVKLPVLKINCEGEYVKTLQILLNKYNNAKLTEDGVFGPATENAVIAWQKDRGLQADGVVGEKSWSQLLK